MVEKPEMMTVLAGAGIGARVAENPEMVTVPAGASIGGEAVVIVKPGCWLKDTRWRDLRDE